MSVYLKTLDGRQIKVRANRLPVECFRCGICCVRYQSPVDRSEIDSLARGMNISPAQIVGKYVQSTVVGYLIRRNERGCVFLGSDGGLASCRVHGFRPEACRNWEAGLDKKECREGLSRLKTANNIILPRELCPSPESWSRLYQALHDQG